MPDEPLRYSPAFGKVPLAFGAVGAAALPGPILIELVRAMDTAGVAATKSLLHRMVQHGMLSVDRIGRVGVYRMIGGMLAGFEAIRTQARMRAQDPWSGAFHTIVYDIPETRRAARERLRAQAFKAGYRQLRPGVLISPTDESTRLDPIGEPDVLLSGRFAVDLGTARRIARIAWELERYGAERRAALAGLQAVLAADSVPEGADALRLWHDVLQPVVDIRFTDGDLPEELLPIDWPATELSAALAAVGRRLSQPIRTWVADVISRSPHRSLLVPLEAMDSDWFPNR